MKLVIAVIQDKDTDRLIDALAKDDFRSTKLASTGGFLGSGNTTLLIGTAPEKVAGALDIIRNTCRSRKRMATPIAPVGMGNDAFLPMPVEVTVGGAIVFVIDVEQFVKV